MNLKALKRKMILLFSTSLLFNLSLLAQSKLIGNYVGNESGRLLILNQDGSFHLLNSSKGVFLHHLDTLSFGSWNQEDGFLVLNSSESIENQSLKIEVDEMFLSDTDSLEIEINNPYEEYFKKVGGKRLFEYSFYITSYDANFGPEIFMKGNKITLHKVEENKIVAMNITIIPFSYLYPTTLAFNYLTTNTYTFNNRNSNYLKVRIPDFSFEYIGYARYKSEYLKVLNNVLLFRGEIFKLQLMEK